MLTSKSHLGKPLISLTDGKKVGEIKDLYIDADARRAAAVFVGTEGLLNRKTHALPRAAVQVYGVDAWLVSGPDTVQVLDTIADASTFTLVGDLRGREILTEGGTRVGVVDDVVLDARAHVLGFTLGKVFVQGPVADRKAIARDAITKLGGKNEPMTTTMAQAETMELPEG
jgi:uncharacterized protein YrrD